MGLHVPCSDQPPLFFNTLKVVFRQFDQMTTTSGFRRGWEWFVDQKGITKCRPRRCTIDPSLWAGLDK
jgi:hypothetical protein